MPVEITVQPATEVLGTSRVADLIHTDVIRALHFERGASVDGQAVLDFLGIQPDQQDAVLQSMWTETSIPTIITSAITRNGRDMHMFATDNAVKATAVILAATARYLVQFHAA